MRTWGSVVFLSVVLVVAGCSSGDDADGDAASSASAGISDSETSLDNVTYHKDIKPILNASCAECHRAGGAGIFDMTNYESAKPWAMAMALAVESRDMPPWGAFETEECSPRFAWQNDHRLSDEEIATVRAWAEAGAPEGNPADGSDEVIMSRTSLPDFDFEGSASLPVTIDGNEDSFICIVIDPGLEEETWLQGVEFIRDNEDLVHHVVLFSDPTRASLDLMNDDGTYTCFGSANVPGQTTIAAWAPGVLPLDLPDNMATRVAPGTLFVMQMHYSPQGGASNLSDKTKLRFRYAKQPPELEYTTVLMGSAPGGLDFSLHPALGILPEADEGNSASFVIPAGAAQHRETVRWTFTGRLPGASAAQPGVGPNHDEIKLLAVGPHMHYAGVDMKVWVDRPTAGETKCESGSLTGLMFCAQTAGCSQDLGFFHCAKNACPELYDAMTLPCWGCAHMALEESYRTGDILNPLFACESEVTPDYTSEQPGRECLVSAPKYNFEWQRGYSYDAPFEELPSFVPGTVLTIECNYNNTMENKLISTALTRKGISEPQDIYLGDETLDEMCVVALNFAVVRKD